MTSKSERKDIYRMPTVFGPATGPRQGPDGRGFECRETPRSTAIAVSFRTNPGQLDALLPEGFSLGDQPVVTVTATYMKDIEGWPAGDITYSVSPPGSLHGPGGNCLWTVPCRLVGESDRSDYHGKGRTGIFKNLLFIAETRPDRHDSEVLC